MIVQNTRFVGLGCKTSFSRIGGTPPYSYSVLAGGAGGTIDSDGLYTAPDSAGSGKDTIVITDSLSSSESSTISVYGPLKLFAEVIRSEMGLQDDQVYLYNQKINAPKDDRLYIAIGVQSLKQFSNSSKFLESGEEENSASIHATLSISIMSRGTVALDRKEEVVLAFNSQYAKTQQESNSFYIAKVTSSFVNLSESEGAAIPYRFNISVNIQYAIRKKKSVQYYDQYTLETEQDKFMKDFFLLNEDDGFLIQENGFKIIL